MPERTEIYVQHRQLLNFISKTSSEDRILEEIWVDPLLTEVPNATHPRARQGLVYPITEHMNVRRKGLYVHPFAANLGCNFYTAPFVLTGCPFHPESVVLEFQPQDNEDDEGTGFACKVGLSWY